MSFDLSTTSFDEAPKVAHHSILFRKQPTAVPSRRMAAGSHAAPVHLFSSNDFDAPPPATIVAAPPEPVHDPLPELLAAARAEGFAAGRAQGLAAGRAEVEADRETAAVAALRMAAAGFAEAARAAAVVAEASAAAIAETALATLCAALPALGEKFGNAEALAFVDALMPVLREEPAVTVQVTADLVAPLAARFASLPQVAVVAEAGLETGDAVLRWQGGDATRRSGAARLAIATALAECGLLTPRAIAEEAALAAAGT